MKRSQRPKPARRYPPWHRKDRDSSKDDLSFLSILRKGVREGLSSTIGKGILALATLIVLGAGGWLLDQFIFNPHYSVYIEGYVMEYDNARKPLEGAMVYVEGKAEVEFETNSSGVYSGRFRVRKNDETLRLNCFQEEYIYETKTVDIPLGENKIIKTDFHLKPK